MSGVTPVTPVGQVQGGMTTMAQRSAPRVADARPWVSEPLVINPSLRFDLKTRLVVMEFFDEVGKLVNSIPSPQKLKAYEAELNGAPKIAPVLSPLGTSPGGAAGERDGLARGDEAKRETAKLALLA